MSPILIDAHGKFFQSNGATMVNTETNMTVEICRVLHSQLGDLFQCSASGNRVQIRTPFVLPDGHQIDLYWRDTLWGQVVSDLGDTHGWLFMNADDGISAVRQEQIYEAVCHTYGVERLDVAMLARVSGGDLANAVIRLAQAITAVSQTLDTEEPPNEVPLEENPFIVDAPTSVIRVPGPWYEPSARSFAEPAPRRVTETRIEDALRTQDFRYERNVQLVGKTSNTWKLDYFVHAAETDAALMALHGRAYLGWQRRAVTHVFSMLTDMLPVWSECSRPVKAISVIDDNDHDWYEEPIQLLSTVSEIVRLSNPDGLVNAIAWR